MNSFHKLIACLLVAGLLLGVLGTTSEAKKKPPKPPDPPSVPVTYEETVLRSLDDTRITEAWDVNDSGTVVGRVRSFDPWGRALVWYPPHTTLPTNLTNVFADWVLGDDDETLSELGITLTAATCINNDEWIAGSVDDVQTEHWGDGIFACNLNSHKLAFLRFANPVRNARATGMGSYGMVVGTFGDLITGTTRLFLWNPKDPIDEADDFLMIVDLADQDPPSHCGIDPEETTVVGKLDGVLRNPIFSFDILDPQPDEPFVPEILADDSHPFYGNITINRWGTIAGSIQHKGGFRPARLGPSMDWELLTSNRKQYGASTDINGWGDICGDEFAGGQGFVFFDSPDDPDVHGFWELDDLGAPTVWLREPHGISDPDPNFPDIPFGYIVGKRDMEMDETPSRAFILIPTIPEPAQ